MPNFQHEKDHIVAFQHGGAENQSLKLLIRLAVDIKQVNVFDRHRWCP